MIIVDIGVGEKQRGDINIDVVRTKHCNLVASAMYLPIKDGSVDMVFCLQVLEHTDNPVLASKEINRVLKKDGEAIIAFPKTFFTNNSFYRLIELVLNLPLIFKPSQLKFLFKSLGGTKERNPRFCHKYKITIEHIAKRFKIVEIEETEDIFLGYLNYGRKSKYFQNKPRIYTAFKLKCRKLES